MSTTNVNEHHQEELSKFLKFFRSRLKTHLENVDADFEDTRSDRLSSDDVYSQKDINEALESLCFAVKASIRSELQDTINMMALLLRQIFAEAEQSKLALELDIGAVENKELLARVERLSVSEWVENEDQSANGVRKKPLANVSASPKKSESNQKRQEEEIRAALHTSQVKQEEATKTAKKLQKQLEEALARNEQLEQAVEEAQQQVSQTKQFQSMKKMVAQKNDQLRDLRQRLQRYEPDGVDDSETKCADDDD